MECAWRDVCADSVKCMGGNVARQLRAGLTAAVLAASIACSNSSTAPSDLNSTGANRATFNVGVRPSPISATRCNPQCPDQSGSKSFAFSADMTIDVQNLAAIGATVNSITLTATADGGTFPQVVLSSDDIKGQAGSNHVDARATLSTPLTILYNTPTGSASLDVGVSVQLTDDRSNQTTATGQVSVR